MALKILKKKKIEKKKQQDRVVDERDIFIEADHPFIARLYYAF